MIGGGSLFHSFLVGTNQRVAKRKQKRFGRSVSVGRSEMKDSFNPVRDQDRISPYYIYTISCRKVMRVTKKISIVGLIIDPKPNSPN